jgi:tRNA (guanosine-2'-O-)-methyltransferase
MENNLIQYLSGFVTEDRFDLFNKILQNRTRYITVVLEDIFQAQNASAVLRTCDCFGIQDVHIIENSNKFELNPKVELGASKWLTLKKYNKRENNSLEAVSELKKNGYRIVVTSPHTNDTSLEDFDLTKGKSALVFGSELPGISNILMNEADEYLKIPMVGFTESFNISVSAAIILHHLSLKLRESDSIPWKLTIDEMDRIKLMWLKKTIKKSDLIEKEFLKLNPDKTETFNHLLS